MAKSKKGKQATTRRKQNKKRGGTKSILVKERTNAKSTKKVSWSGNIPEPKQKLGRTRSRTKKAANNNT